MMEYPENLLTKRIIQCIIKIHQSIDQSFLENIYWRTMIIEFTKQELF
ncbi:MAG: GxxExxY protein [bacterium]